MSQLRIQNASPFETAAKPPECAPATQNAAQPSAKCGYKRLSENSAQACSCVRPLARNPLRAVAPLAASPVNRRTLSDAKTRAGKNGAALNFQKELLLTINIVKILYQYVTCAGQDLIVDSRVQYNGVCHFPLINTTRTE